MSRAIATLLVVVAITFLDRPAGLADAQAQSQAAPRQTPRPTKKAKVRPPKARPVRPGTAVPKPSVAVVPLESEVGPSESDVARLARVRARREAVEREIVKLRGQVDSTLRELDSIDLDLRLAAHQLDEA